MLFFEILCASYIVIIYQVYPIFCSKSKPVEYAYDDIKKAVLDSEIIRRVMNLYTRMVNAYPATIKYLEEDKIDSEENFFFHKSADGVSRKASAVKQNTDFNKHSFNKEPPKSITPTATSSTSNIQNSISQPSPSSNSKTPPPKKTIKHEKVTATQANVGLTITEEVPPKQEAPGSIRKPQSMASLEREIQDFISSGPPEQPILYTCPGCKSKGLICIRGCPKENTTSKTDQQTKQE